MSRTWGRLPQDFFICLVSSDTDKTDWSTDQESGILMQRGPLAHLVEHHICNVGVTGSNPVRSTE